MDTAPWVWVVVAVVVVVLIVLLLLVGGRRRKAMQEKRDQEHREKAAEIRREAQNMEIDAREREAKAIRARADAEQAQVDAARLRQEAEQRSQEAQSLRGDVASHARKADELDPDVGRDAGRDRREGDGRLAHDGHGVEDRRGQGLTGPAREAGGPADSVTGGDAEYVQDDRAASGQGYGSHRDAAAATPAADANTDLTEAEAVRRRESRAADAPAENDVPGGGTPRTGI
ncbi:heme exporter protein CcmD [Pseudarthrobacter sp. NPDC080039]|uniref:heme exporter protein CcmD n=1 Tax=unclassified Pseudarthrobacter TaxID=2647000 RepID=UPI00344D4964